MRADISVTQTLNNLASLRRAMTALTDQDVYIGIPADESAREKDGDTGISNAYLGYIHEHGVPGKIPARAALIPGIEDIRAEAVDILANAAARALEGNAGAVEQGLKSIGLQGQKAVQARFVNNDWPALSDKTLDYKPLKKDDAGNVLTDRKGKPKRKQSRREKGRTNPLIDSSQLRKAYTYVLRKRGKALILK